MNIHEHQAKDILKKFGAPVPNGEPIFDLSEIENVFKKFNSKKLVLKAQIHAGGRGKAGGIKVINNLNELKQEAQKLFGKKLITHQTGPEGREVKRLYLEEASIIDKEFYLSCLVDRSSSKIAFISSAEGGMDIEEVASKSPNKIITTKVDIKDNLTDEEIFKILSPYDLKDQCKSQGLKLIQSIYKTMIKTDASLIEINPLITTKTNNIVCLDAKISFDDNACLLYTSPSPRDLSTSRMPSSA